MSEITNKNPSIRIKVSGEGENVNICFPYFVVKAMLKSNQVSESLDNIDIDLILKNIENGERGKLLDIETDGTRVEITAE